MAILIPSLLGMAYSVSHIPPSSVDVKGFVEWVQASRSTWDEAILLGVPVTVLFPSVLTVLLGSSPSSIDGRHRTAREEAFLETIRDVLLGGLLVGVFLALLASIPKKGDVDLPLEVLALATAGACAMLTGTLRADGTQRDLLVAKARARRDAALVSRLPLRAHVRQRAPWAVGLLTPGALTNLKVQVLIAAVTGGPPVVILWLRALSFGMPGSWLSASLVSTLLVAYLGGQALFLLSGLSRRRLSTSTKERAGALGYWLVPAVVLGVHVLTAAMTGGSPATVAVLWALVGAVIAADLIAVVVDRTIVGTILDYRRLTALKEYARSQINYLSDDTVAPAVPPALATRTRSADSRSRARST